jgi:hypothetical protein
VPVLPRLELGLDSWCTTSTLFPSKSSTAALKHVSPPNLAPGEPCAVPPAESAAAKNECTAAREGASKATCVVPADSL